ALLASGETVSDEPPDFPSSLAASSRAFWKSWLTKGLLKRSGDCRGVACALLIARSTPRLIWSVVGALAARAWRPEASWLRRNFSACDRRLPAAGAVLPTSRASWIRERRN